MSLHRLRHAPCPVCKKQRLTVSSPGGLRRLRPHYLEPRYVRVAPRCSGSGRLVQPSHEKPL